MGSKTKIVVFKMRELIYTGIFVTLGIILIILFIFMFTPRDKEKAKEICRRSLYHSNHPE